jgi:hypothetical protein
MPRFLKVYPFLILLALTSQGQSQSNPGNAAATSPQPSATTIQGGEPWYSNADSLATVGSVGALLISVLALVVSYQSVTEQRMREKRDELRGLMEKLIALREELDFRISRLPDAWERQEYGKTLNQKRTIYLQSAETLAAQLGDSVSSPEYLVLGRENLLESDFVQAIEYYKRAVKVSARDSPANKGAARRALASCYFMKEPFKNIAEGRRQFRALLEILSGSTDPYSLFMQADNFVYWSSQEFGAENYDESASRVEDAIAVCSNIPYWYSMRWDILRNIASQWRWHAGGYYPHGQPLIKVDVAKGRELFQRALDTLRGMSDDGSVDLHGQILQEWARVELLSGSKEQGNALLERARQNFSDLPPQYPRREERLRGIHVMLLAIEEGQERASSAAIQSEPSVPDALSQTLPPPGTPPASPIPVRVSGQESTAV